jgi:hypothetical protein
MLRRLIVIGLLTGIIAFGQRGGGSKGGGGGGAGMPSMGFGGASKLDRISTMLNLSKDQKKDFKQTFDDAQKEAKPVHEQLTKTHMAIGEAVAEGKQDELAKTVTAEAALETQMTTIEIRAFTKVVAGLDEEQKAKASQVFAMMRGLFSSKDWNTD